MKDMETTSLNRVEECGVFRQCTRDAFRKAGREAVEDGAVIVRDGFREFVDRVRRRGHRVWIVSVNWSAAFIEGVCDVPDIRVVANEIEEDGRIVGPAILGARGHGSDDERWIMTNSGDKLEAMKYIISQTFPTSSRGTWYFGDSITDMECLLEASKGIVISDTEDSTLLKTLRRLDKQVPMVRDWKPESDLCWVSGFRGVMESSLFRSLVA